MALAAWGVESAGRGAVAEALVNQVSCHHMYCGMPDLLSTACSSTWHGMTHVM